MTDGIRTLPIVSIGRQNEQDSNGEALLIVGRVRDARFGVYATKHSLA